MESYRAQKERVDLMKIYEKVSKVLDLYKMQQLDACQRLMNGTATELCMLKGLPDEKKKS